MVITYYGEAFLKVSFGDTVVAVNPIGKSANNKSARFGADLAISSCHDDLFNGVTGLTGGGKEPFIIDGPGEYEYSGIFVKGYESVGPAGLVNTIYSFLLEGIRVVCLGALANTNLPPDTLEEISGADIIFVPAGEADTLSARVAAKFASSLEPKVIIPVMYGDEKSDKLKEFLSETGETKAVSVDKLSLKKKDLEGKEAEVVVLQVV